MRDWQADFAVFDESGQLALVVRATTQADVDTDWATAWYRNYLGHSWRSRQPFVLLATPHNLYVWKAGPTSESTPAATADAQRVFSPYFSGDAARLSDLSRPAFEFIVGAWLDDLSHGLWKPTEPDQLSALVDTGLVHAIENGRVVADIAA